MIDRMASAVARFLDGVRLFDVSQSLRVAEDPALEASTTVVDPILGAVGTWELGDRWRFGMRGDIGGFGVGSSSLTSSCWSSVSDLRREV